MESAERNGLLFRRLLLSADRFNDAAIRLGSRNVKTPLSRVSASLCSVTCCDQSRPVSAARRDEPLRRGLRRLRPALLLEVAVFLTIAPPRRKRLSSRLNAPALSLFRGSLRRPPAALSRRETDEVPGNRRQ